MAEAEVHGIVIPLSKIEKLGKGEIGMALCPYHMDDKGSLVVRFKKRRFFCFDCLIGGRIEEHPAGVLCIEDEEHEDLLSHIEHLRERDVIRRVRGREERGRKP